MAEQQYDLFFSGELLDGFFIDFVKADLQSLFNASTAYVDALFSGQAQVIKRKVDKATAIKYQQAFKKAGARLIVRIHSAEVAVPAPPQPKAVADETPPPAPVTEAISPDKPVDHFETILTAVPGENADNLIERHQPAIAPPEEVPDWQLDAPGTQLIAPSQTVEPDLEVSDLSIAETGADLKGDFPVFEEPAPLIRPVEVTLAPAGAVIEVLDDKAEPVQVDISHLHIE